MRIKATHSYLLTFSFILILFSLNIASAISADIKDSYLPSETIITKISGVVLGPLGPGNVELRRGHVLVPMDFELKKLGEAYYFWALAPESQMNYTLIIKNITTFVSGSVQDVNYEKNFSVSGNIVDYYVKPGVISTDRDFEFKVRLNEDIDKSIDVSFIGTTSFLLKPGDNFIKFSISAVNETSLFNASIGKYNTPIYIRVNKTAEFGLPGGKQNATRNLTNLTIVEKNLSESEEEAINVERAKYRCYEFPGKICGAEETCSGESIVSLDGACCVNGDCAAKGAAGGSRAWIGYLIAAIVIIAGIFIWIKYKKVKKETNPVIKKAISLERRGP